MNSLIITLYLKIKNKLIFSSPFFFTILWSKFLAVFCIFSENESPCKLQALTKNPSCILQKAYKDTLKPKQKIHPTYSLDQLHKQNRINASIILRIIRHLSIFPCIHSTTSTFATSQTFIHTYKIIIILDNNNNNLTPYYFPSWCHQT